MQSHFLIISIFLTIAFDACASGANRENQYNLTNTQNENSFLGTWKISSYRLGNITAITEQDAAKFIGKTIFLGENSAELIDDLCESPNYNITEEKTRPYLHEMYRINPEKIGIKEDELSILNLTCERESYEIIMSNKNLLLFIDGVFFVLEKLATQSTYAFNGSGNFEEKIIIDRGARRLSVKYHFYSAPDQLLIKDAAGNVLFDTGMKSTKIAETKEIELSFDDKDQKELLLIIKTKEEKNSTWRVFIN